MSTPEEIDSLTHDEFLQARQVIARQITNQTVKPNPDGTRRFGMPQPSAKDLIRAERLISAGYIDIEQVIERQQESDTITKPLA